MYPTFTKQETFDIVAKHLLTQNVQSVDSNNHCLYRGPDGLMCAAGILIPDQDYTDEMDNNNPSIAELVDKHDMDTWFGHDMELTSKLQLIHDVHTPDNWFARLVELAKSERLQFNA
jgi:hypothetical protein